MSTNTTNAQVPDIQWYKMGFEIIDNFTSDKTLISATLESVYEPYYLNKSKPNTIDLFERTTKKVNFECHVSWKEKTIKSLLGIFLSTPSIKELFIRSVIETSVQLSRAQRSGDPFHQMNSRHILNIKGKENLMDGFDFQSKYPRQKFLQEIENMKAFAISKGIFPDEKMPLKCKITFSPRNVLLATMVIATAILARFLR